MSVSPSPLTMKPRRMLSAYCLYLLLTSCLQGVSGTLVRQSLDQYPNALCTDGTPAAYYHTDTADVYDNYVIFLQGGGYCHTVGACHFRCMVAGSLCTTCLTSHKENTGVLSDDPGVNPGFYQYYKVELPYCTGDMYIGRRPASEDTDHYSFLGRDVFTATIESLKNRTNIKKAVNVVLTGSSAGGAGVAFNCDYLKSLLPNAQIWCVVDAAFFYPIQLPFRTGLTCDDPITEVLTSGAELWNAPEVGQFSLQGWWSGIEQHLFIGSAKFDRFGMESFCGNTTDRQDLALWGPAVIHMAHQLLAQYPDVGLFMPGCVGHMMLTDDRVFNQLKAGKLGITYAEALSYWVNENGPFRVWDKCLRQPFCNAQCKNGRLHDMVI